MPDLQDGETTEMQGSGAKPYVLVNSRQWTQSAARVAVHRGITDRGFRAVAR